MPINPSSAQSRIRLWTVLCMIIMFIMFINIFNNIIIIYRSRNIYSKLSSSSSSQAFSPGKRLASTNPYIQRITTIRETVTKNARIGSVASRLKKCLTRTSLFSIHCWMALILSIILGILYCDIPYTRDGIEERESLFHVIVSEVRIANVWWWWWWWWWWRNENRDRDRDRYTYAWFINISIHDDCSYPNKHSSLHLFIFSALFQCWPVYLPVYSTQKTSPFSFMTISVDSALFISIDLSISSWILSIFELFPQSFSYPF